MSPSLVKARWISLLFLLSLIFESCGIYQAGTEPVPVLPPEIPPSPVAEPTSTSMPGSPLEEVPLTPSLPTPADAGLQSLIDKAIADLSQRLSIPVTEIQLVEATPVVWPDSSLGCPQPGMGYAQVLTPGYLIRLEVDTQTYEYHANRTTYVTFCEDPSPPVPGTPADV